MSNFESLSSNIIEYEVDYIEFTYYFGSSDEIDPTNYGTIVLIDETSVLGQLVAGRDFFNLDEIPLTLETPDESGRYGKLLLED